MYSLLRHPISPLLRSDQLHIVLHIVPINDCVQLSATMERGEQSHTEHTGPSLTFIMHLLLAATGPVRTGTWVHFDSSLEELC